MKIKVIIPINDGQYNEEVHSVVASIAPSDLQIEVENISQGKNHIQGRYELAFNSLPVIDLIKKAEDDGFDGVFVSDFDMCGVEAAREIVDIPVVGGFRASAYFAMMLSHRFSIITILESVVDLQAGHPRDFGILPNFASIYPIGLQVHDLVDREKVIQSVFEKSLLAIERDGASSILLGCTGFLDIADRVESMLKAAQRPAVVIDPNKAAVSFLYMLIKNKKSQSRLTYAKLKVN